MTQKLICDPPVAGDSVEYYTLAGLPGDPRVDLDPSGEFGFEYNLEGLPSGDYSLTVSACNDWQCSLPAPLSFTVPDQPSQPTNLRVISE